MDRETKVILAFSAGWLLGIAAVVGVILFWGT